MAFRAHTRSAVPAVPDPQRRSHPASKRGACAEEPIPTRSPCQETGGRDDDVSFSLPEITIAIGSVTTTFVRVLDLYGLA